MKNYLTGFSKSMMICISIFAMIQFSSCVSKQEFITSTVVPAARGYVKVKKDKNENNIINIEMSHLAEPDRLLPPKQTYVVWLVTDDNQTKNIGQISYSNKSGSKDLKTSFETVTVFKPMRIFITAENDATITYPGTQIILSTGLLKK